MLLAIEAKRVDSRLFRVVGVGAGSTTGVGVDDGSTTGVGVDDGVDVFFEEEVYVRPLKSNDPGNQNLQRSEVPSGTSPTVHG